MRRFFVPPENVGENVIVIDDRDDLHHMRRVLRLTPGDELDISDSAEWEYRARLITLGDDRAEAQILDKQRFAAEPETRITLFQGIPKQGKMETIVQKSVELGVAAIVPVFMARTVVADKGNFDKKIQRWQKIADEAVKQCRRGVIPQVSAAVRAEALPELLTGYDLVLIPYENEDETSIKDVLRSDDAAAAGNIALIIGPEGGFAAEEVERAAAAGAKAVSLGRTVLRTETAGPAAIAMIMYEKEL